MVAPCLPTRPLTHRNYTEESMLKAYETVQKGDLGIRRASEMYGVPRTTLQDRISGKVPLNARCGSGRLLTDEEESRLADFLIGCSTIGYAKSRKDVLAIVQQILDARNAGVMVTKGWWASYQRRHPNLTLRHAEPLAYARAVANNHEVINRYFDLLEKTLRENNLIDRPAQIFNCDETGMPLMHKPPKVIAGVGQKHPYTITGSDRSQITILACANAAGYCIPPMVVFDCKVLNPKLAAGEVPGTFYGLSDSGWMDSELFEGWFKNHFIPHAPPVRPLLLMLDRHSSHYQPELLRIAASEGIIIFCLPPHTTRLLQPLDGCTFGSLKRHWGEECHIFCSRNPGKVVNRYNFSSIFRSAWMQGMSMQNVMASFREVGVYPTNRERVLSKLSTASTDIQPSQEHTSTVTPFVPFCTPRAQPVKITQPSVLTTPERTPLHTHGRVETMVTPPRNDISVLHTASPVPSLSLPFTTAEVQRFQKRLRRGLQCARCKICTLVVHFALHIQTTCIHS